MGHGARQRAGLRALQRRVWGDGVYEQQVRRRTRRRQRLHAVVVTGIGAQLILTAVGLVLLSTAASAHTSTINISCTQVEFVYQNFPNVTATAHESVVVNGVEIASRDITFQGPGTTDTITITLGPGSSTIVASDRWMYHHRPQGSANANQTLSSCHPNSTTTTHPSTTTAPSTASTSTVPRSSTTTSPSSTVSTTTSVPETSSSAPSSTSVPETSTSSVPETSTSSATSTTIGPGTSTTIHELGSTTTTIEATTSSTVHEQGSTTTTIGSGKLPFTGSSGVPLAAALGALGIGVLAVGAGRLHKAIERA